MNKDLIKILNEAKELDLKNKPHASLSLIYDTIEPLLRNGEFDYVNEFLNSIDVSDLSVNLILGILSVTYPAMHKLSGRKNLISRAEVRIKSLGRNVNSLLKELKQPWTNLGGRIPNEKQK